MLNYQRVPSKISMPFYWPTWKKQTFARYADICRYASFLQPLLKPFGDGQRGRFSDIPIDKACADPCSICIYICIIYIYLSLYVVCVCAMICHRCVVDLPKITKICHMNVPSHRHIFNEFMTWEICAWLSCMSCQILGNLAAQILRVSANTVTSDVHPSC